MEYERRFRLEQLPDGLSGPSTMIRQVYWNLGGGWALRLRRTGNSDDLDDEVAIKGPRRGMSRPEFEYALRDAKGTQTTEELRQAAQELYRAGSGHQIVKTRHSFLDGTGEAWDIDEFHHANQGLIIAEVEKESALAVASVDTPDWAVEDVTGDARFNNEVLAFRPWPQW